MSLPNSPEHLPQAVWLEPVDSSSAFFQLSPHFAATSIRSTATVSFLTLGTPPALDEPVRALDVSMQVEPSMEATSATPLTLSSSSFSSPSSSSFSSSSPAETSHAAVDLKTSSSVSVSQPITEQHRRTNKQRRHHENAAFRRLDELNRRSDHYLLAPALPTPPTGRQKRQKRGGRNKLTVLQASAARIERLEQALGALEAAHRVSEETARRVSDELSLAVQRERHELQWLDSTRSLHSSTLLDDRFSCILIDWASGRALHANSLFYEASGFTPSGVLQHAFARPGSATAPLAEPVLVRQRRRSSQRAIADTGSSNEGDGRAALCAEEAGELEFEWVPRRHCRQYPASIKAMVEVWKGVRASCYVPLFGRTMYTTYELQTHMWVTEFETFEDASGRKGRRPVRFVVASAVDERSACTEEYWSHQQDRRSGYFGTPSD